jgi:hypothetical protein
MYNPEWLEAYEFKERHVEMFVTLLIHVPCQQVFNSGIQATEVDVLQRHSTEWCPAKQGP